MNEWEFTAQAASWINEILSQNDGVPFSSARCEQRAKSAAGRRDLSLLDNNGRNALTGEIKLPYAKDGGSPYNANVVTDAHKKAVRAGSRFFFTWNVNEFVLWETVAAGATWQERNYKAWDVTEIHREEHLDLPATTHAIRKWLEQFLGEFSQIFLGTSQIAHKSPDEKFIDALESSLRIPILLTIEELEKKYKLPKVKCELDKWMRDELGWTISDDPEAILENLTRAAKFACYTLINRLVFYEALLKNFSKEMSGLQVPEHLDNGDNLYFHLEGFFARAREITGDYETVFGEEHTSIGHRIPFYSDGAVVFWRELINQIHKFDFSKLDYEIIGNIFERLISPEERRKFGQFYTRVEVVDLINSFCIRTGNESVMDPACGGGTFLVRAYARKKAILPNIGHRKILDGLYGVDVSNFATHLTTINLATRDLIDEENYPQIARSDFFDIKPKGILLSLPAKYKIKSLGDASHREVEIKPLDAIIGNPPYVRQEGINKDKKAAYIKLIQEESTAKLSGRSDLHCFFWPHAAGFIKDDGYLCFLTSSQWLDVDYGFHLQEWILNNFEIVAILESVDEPWFIGARVSTAITILKRQLNERKRMENVVKFVQLRRPIREILSHDGSTMGAVLAANGFRDELIALSKDTVCERYVARLVRQGELWEQGVRLGKLMGKGKDSNGDEEGEEISNGGYYGGKWGSYLRAPDLWFDLLARFGSKLVPLGEIVEIRRGVTSGKDIFFYPKDASAECLQAVKDSKEFKRAYGLAREEVESGDVKLVRCGAAWTEIRPIEAEFLEPEVHSLMEIDKFTVGPESCEKNILLVDKKKSELKGTYAYKYITWGEKQRFHEQPTCTGRASESHTWFDLTHYKRAEIILPKIQQYKLIAFLNPHKLHINSSLLGLYNVPAKSIKPLCGILNSTISILSRLVFARMLGNEGNIQLDVYLANMMLVPDPSHASREQLKHIATAFEKMKKRKALQLISERRLREMAFGKAGRKDELAKLSDKCELDMPDRRELDDAVLEMLGVTSEKQRQKIIDQLYDYLRAFFEATRQKEEKAIENKNKAKRRGAARPADIAAQIYEEISNNENWLLRAYEPGFIDLSKPFDTFHIPAAGKLKAYSDMLMPNGVKVENGRNKQNEIIETKNPLQGELIVLLAEQNIRGFVRAPHEEEECHRVLNEYNSFIHRRDKRLSELIEERTADEDIQAKILGALLHLILHGA